MNDNQKFLIKIFKLMKIKKFNFRINNDCVIGAQNKIEELKMYIVR